MYRSLISLMPKAQPLLLDLFPNASVAYSLRKLRTAYSGSAIRVRRSSDNAEQNIGFVGNNLDTTSLLTFCGAGNGFITAWYDQSGANRNITQTTAGSQPRIVLNGVIETKDSENAIRFDGSNDFLTRAALAPLNSGSNYTYFTVASNNLTENFNTIFSTSTGGSLRLEVFIDTRTTGGLNLLIRTVNSTYTAGLSAPNGSLNQRLLAGVVNGFNMSAFDNGNIGGTAVYAGTYTNDIFDVGTWRAFPRYLNGTMQEIIIYPTDQSANRTGIETNINSHYNVY
jgi:hypothetical protein